MVYAGLFPIDNAQFPELRDALDKLKLNDAALIYEPETSVALGFGFRCGFLGLLHMEIVSERLEREFGLDLISTAPNVPYEVTAEDGTVHRVTNPSEFPDGKIKTHRRADGAPPTSSPPRSSSARSWTCARTIAAPWARWTTSPRPRGDALPHAAGRDRVRLLRPAEVPHQGLRLARLPRGRRTGRRPGQGRHPASTATRWTRSAPSCTATRRTATV